MPLSGLHFLIGSGAPQALVMLSSLHSSTDPVPLLEIASVQLYGFHPVIESFSWLNA